MKDINIEEIAEQYGIELSAEDFEISNEKWNELNHGIDTTIVFSGRLY